MVQSRLTQQDRELLRKVQSFESKWKNQFESKPALPLSFGVSAFGELTLNGRIIDIQLNRIDPGSFYCDLEYFGFSLINGESYDFIIEWPFDAEPFLRAIRHTIPWR